MNDEIKEILDWLKDEDIYVEDYGFQYKRISLKEIKQLLDYITNLQQELQEANDSVEWWSNRFKAVERDNRELTQENEELKKKLDRRYYKNEYERIKQENERLQENNSNMQEEMARVWEENERLKEEQEYNNYCDKQLRKKISNLEYKITTLENYKSRCEKAIEFINKYCIDDEFYINLSYKEKAIIEVLNILQNESEKDG